MCRTRPMNVEGDNKHAHSFYLGLLLSQVSPPTKNDNNNKIKVDAICNNALCNLFCYSMANILVYFYSKCTLNFKYHCTFSLIYGWQLATVAIYIFFGPRMCIHMVFLTKSNESL